jgi:adenylate kinase family enzyme
MEQALFLEKNLKEISCILNVSADQDLMLSRILSRGKLTGRADDQQEATVRNRLREYNERSFPVIQFYQKYGAVRDIDAKTDVNNVYQNFTKIALFPDVYCIIGKRYSGKTVIAKAMAARMNAKVIDFPAFMKQQ